MADHVSLTDLHPDLHRRALARLLLRSGATFVFIVAAFFVVPIDRTHQRSGLLFVILGAAVVGAVIAWQGRAILRADHPQLRAVEAAIVAVTLFVVTFAILYFAISQAKPASFTQPLDRVRALYFTVTVLTTVGFGDITARTDAARMVVTAQMVIDVVMIAVVLRVLFGLARVSQNRLDTPTVPGDS